MSGFLMLFGASTMLGGLVGYAWWTKVRVWMLRQDLFLVRDRLWDEMSARGELDAPSHRWCRDLLNETIRFAPVLSWWTILVIMRHQSELTPAPVGREPRDLPQPVIDARKAAEALVLRYLFRWSLLGLTIWYFLKLRGGLEAWQARIATIVKLALPSKEIDTVGRRLANV